MADFTLGNGRRVSVRRPEPPRVVASPPTSRVAVLPVRGPRGRAGNASADSGWQHDQTTPAATWTVDVPDSLTRLPTVTLYVAGEQCDTEVHVTDSLITLVFPEPTTGVVILT